MKYLRARPGVSPSSTRMTASIFGSYVRTILRPSFVSKRPHARLPGPIEHGDDDTGGAPGVLAAPAPTRRPGRPPPGRGPCRRPSRRASLSGARRGRLRSLGEDEAEPLRLGTVIRPAIMFENSMAEYFSPRTFVISPRRSRASRRERKAVSSMSRRPKAFIRSWNDRTREPLSRRRSRMLESGGSTGRSLSCRAFRAAPGAVGGRTGIGAMPSDSPRCQPSARACTRAISRANPAISGASASTRPSFSRPAPTKRAHPAA